MAETKLSIVFAFLLVLAVSKAYPSSSLKDISSMSALLNNKCGKLECPKYEVEKTEIGDKRCELRCYPSYAWVETRYEGEEKPSPIMFRRLSEYMQGENDMEVKMNMTVPVVTKVETTRTGKLHTMLFFVPYKYQSSPPQPTDPQVSITRSTKTCFYVMDSLTTRPWSKTLIEVLLEEMQDIMMEYDITDYVDPKEFYIYGGYDSPKMEPWLRVNEIGLLQQ